MNNKVFFLISVMCIFLLGFPGIASADDDPVLEGAEITVETESNCDCDPDAELITSSSKDYTVANVPWCYPSGDPNDQYNAEVGGLNSTASLFGGGVGAFICNWWCGDDGASFSYNPETEEWTTTSLFYGDDGDSGFDSDKTNAVFFPGFLNSDSESTIIPSCQEGNYEGSNSVWDICWQEVFFDGTNLSCGGNYSVSVSATPPCPAVERKPYPRGLVSVPNYMIVSSGGSNIEHGSRGDCDLGVRNYQIALGWFQLDSIPPIWQFDERPWSSAPNMAAGYSVVHTYETASFGLEENGPSLNGLLELPSYQVSVATFWEARIRESWDQWDDKSFNCQSSNSNYATCVQEKQYCDTLTLTVDDPRCGQWNPRGSSWIAIDLRTLGNTTTYLVQSGAMDITQAVPPIPSVPNSARQCSIPVPIVEVQSVLVGD